MLFLYFYRDNETEQILYRRVNPGGSPDLGLCSVPD